MKKITATIANLEQLKSAYLPFLVNGGVLVPSEADHEIGNDVLVELNLFCCNEPLDFSGKIVWTSPSNMHTEAMLGTGIEFSDEQAKALCKQFEIFLTCGTKVL